MPEAAWQRVNLAAIERRLVPLRLRPDGVLYDARAGLHHIRIVKQGSELQLFFVGAGGALDGPMSRIDLARPLHLQAGYAQALLLALLWRPDPQRACVLGFGGGRVSLVLHHYLPALTIDNVEIDPAFATIAPAYFGLGFDARQILHIADARAFLEAAPEGYDLILMDAFRDDTDQLNHLATTQFYELCAQRLVPGGVLAANILKSDPHCAAKARALFDRFPAGYLVDLKYSLVLFGATYQRLDLATLARRAAELQARHGFDFPLRERAANLRGRHDLEPRLQQSLRVAAPLDDAERG